MISEQSIREAVRRIVADGKSKKVVLFGSYGRGNPGKDSDLDLMIIQERVDNPAGEMVRVHEAVGDVGVGVDVLVFSEEEVARRGRIPGTVIYRALREGKVLYDASP